MQKQFHTLEPSQNKLFSATLPRNVNTKNVDGIGGDRLNFLLHDDALKCPNRVGRKVDRQRARRGTCRVSISVNPGGLGSTG